MEIEIKLAPAPCRTWDAIQKNEEFFLSPSRTFEMAASYFDTPDRALKREGISLRLRKENGESVCCLKSRVSQNARQEFEVQARTIESGIMELCAKAELPESTKTLLQTARLECLYSSRFTRVCRLISAGESTVEIAFDSGELCRGALRCAVSEIELELKKGSESDLEALCAYLQARYSLPRSNSTKAGRASALQEETFEALEPIDTSALTAEQTDALYTQGKLWKKQTGSIAEYRKSRGY